MAAFPTSYYTGNIRGQNGTFVTVLNAILTVGEGWTEPFTGTNRRVFRNGDGFVWRVLDDGSLPAGARECVLRGAENATDVDTLVDPFPTVAQQADTACVVRKSDTADATDRPYRAWANGNFIIINIFHETFACDWYMIGRPVLLFPGDTYGQLTSIRPFGNNGNGNVASNAFSDSAWNGIVSDGIFWARTEDGAVKSTRGSRISRLKGNNIGQTPGATGRYPHPRTADLALFPVQLATTGTTTALASASCTVRAIVPGVFEPPLGDFAGHSGLNHLDTFTSTAYSAASEFVAVSSNSTNTFQIGGLCIQSAGDWLSPEFVA